MTERIYMSSPDITEAEEQAVLAAIRSGWVAPLGPDVDAFEEEMCERIGVDHAVALSSGTAALHLGLLGLGVKPGDVVLTATMTFAATANAVVYTGAEPYFIDCEPDTGNMNPVLLREALVELRRKGERVGAILPVDLLGKAANYTEIEQIAAEFEVPVLADAAESLGAFHAGKPTGSFGDAAVFSFNGNKIMTTSGGGMLLTNSDDLAGHARYLATQARQPVAHYEHIDIGYNYRMSNLLAALGRAQLTRLDEMISRRRLLRDRYKELFAGVPGVSIFGAENDEHDNVWLTAIGVNTETTGWEAAELSTYLARHNIESRPIWKPMHLQPVFSGARSRVDGTSKSLFKTHVTLPSGSALTEAQQVQISNTISEFVGAA